MRRWIIGGGILAVLGIAAVIIFTMQGPAEGDEGDEFQLHPEARIIEDDTEIISYDLDTGELRTTGPLEEGEVLVAGVTPATPYGMMVRIESVSDEGTAAQTTQATLTDVIASTGGVLTVEGEAVDVEVTTEDGVTYAPNLSGGAAGTYSPVIEAELAHTFTFDKSHTSNGVTYKATGKLYTGANASLLVDIGLFSGLKELEAKITPKTSATVELEVARKSEFEHELKLGKIDRTWLYWVGPVPVVMTTGLDVSLDTSLKLAAQAKIETSASGQVAMGFRYKDGQGGGFFEPSGDAKGPALSGDGTQASATVRAELAGELKAEFYKVLGFSGGAGPYAQVKVASTVNNPVMQCTWGAGLTGKITTSAGIKALGVGERKWTASADVPFVKDRRCPGYRPDPLAFTPSGVASQLRSMDWQVGTAIDDVQVGATGGSPTGDGYTFGTTGDLPPGITFTTTDEGGTLSGTPTTEGTYSFTLTVTDGRATKRAVVRAVVEPEPLPPPEPLFHIPSDGLMGAVGQSAYMPFGFGGGRGPYTITVTQGTLPPGLELERTPEAELFELATAEAVVSGTLTQAGEWPVVIRAEDAAGQVVEVPFTFEVSDGPPEYPDEYVIPEREPAAEGWEG